ncbi:unnamed protein product [Mytilus edulis]|uniref:DNA-directed DNA polymerase n=1 Tax=Mytilus edulis TaxID=6550 RepID=A0A8S3U7S3_MYTED|nr:unnamed protein product [Mytilus edulis]
MENVRERVDIKLISNEEKLRKYVAKPSFKRFKIFNEHLIGVEMTRVSIELNRPAYLGAQILDISKNLMAWFHHLVMKPKYGNNLELLFTDTDSLCYEIATDDIYEDMENMREYFDTSNYDESLPIHSNNYKKIPGRIAMKEFIGLRPKMYSLIYNEVDHRDDNLESEVREVAKITTKGITKTARDKHEHFRRCLLKTE